MTLSLKFSDPTKKRIIKGLKEIIDQLFSYVESEEECQILFKHMKNYYNGIKGELKSEDGCNAIEKLLLLLQSNVDYASSHVFKNVTCFDFRGDSIAESSYSIAKSGSQAIASNTTLNTPAKKIIMISENRARENDW